MTKVKLTRCFSAAGVVYWPDSVADEPDVGRANYLLGMASVEASAAAVTTPPAVPARIAPEPMRGRPGSLTRAVS